MRRSAPLAPTSSKEYGCPAPTSIWADWPQSSVVSVPAPFHVTPKRSDSFALPFGHSFVTVTCGFALSVFVIVQPALWPRARVPVQSPERTFV